MWLELRGFGTGWAVTEVAGDDVGSDEDGGGAGKEDEEATNKKD